MFKRAQQFLLILFMFQFVLGSTAWMYSSHFCKMQDDCAYSTEVSCGAESEYVDGVEVPAAESCCSPTSETSCCFEINPYINFPVYRILKTELPDDNVVLALFFEKSLDVIGVSNAIDRNTLSLNFSDVESPPLDKHILYNVFRI
jgi:hypothetical protein